MCDRGVPFHAGGTRSAVPRRMRPPTLRALVRVVPLTFVAGCAATMPFSPLTPATVSSGMPLGPSYMLVAAPADDASLLGCTASDSPGRGWSIAAGGLPGACAEKLTPADGRELPGTFEDTLQLAPGGNARAALERFGFDDVPGKILYFHYRLAVTRLVSRRATPEYASCCRAGTPCGDAFVTTLLYGDGEYSLGVESNEKDASALPLDGASDGFVFAKVVRRTAVHGYLAAELEERADGTGELIGLLGDPAAVQPRLNKENLSPSARALFESHRIDVVALEPSPAPEWYAFRDARGRSPRTSSPIDTARSRPLTTSTRMRFTRNRTCSAGHI